MIEYRKQRVEKARKTVLRIFSLHQIEALVVDLGLPRQNGSRDWNVSRLLLYWEANEDTTTSLVLKLLERNLITGVYLDHGGS